MRIILQTVLLILCLGAFSTGNAQNLKDLYVSRPQEGGALYHLFPLTLFESKENGDLVFDLTYLQFRDSVTINFTYSLHSVSAADSVCFRSGNNILNGKTEKLYIEAGKGGEWIHRYSLKCPVMPLFLFFREENIPIVTLYVRNGTIPYTVKKTVWKKMSPKLYSLFKFIREENHR